MTVETIPVMSVALVERSADSVRLVGRVSDRDDPVLVALAIERIAAHRERRQQAARERDGAE